VNLAAFEMVDYVVIDERDKPLEKFRLIEPDYFAKGFEYGGQRACRQDRRGTRRRPFLRRRIDLTPGDVVALVIERLYQDGSAGRPARQLADRDGTQQHHLESSAACSAKWKSQSHVVGDTIVDSYTQCAMIGRPDQNPDHERSVSSARSISSAAPASSPSILSRWRQGHFLDRARQRSVERLCY